MKNPPYFICGLPRSRTAWLANMMTYGPSFCHHDAIRLGVSAQSLIKLFEATDAEFVGDSDSSLTAIPYECAHHFPESRWVLIHREPDQCAASYQKHFGPEPYPHLPKITDEQAVKSMEWCRKRVAVIQSIIPDSRRMDIAFPKLDEEATCHGIWEFCLRGTTPFSRQRWHMLNTFRVNIIPSKVVVAGDLIEQCKGLVWEL